ncbi:hypothetical protein BC351_06210 [Paenibacillus ferrarius]|uniref:Dipeptidylpeptidase IV N-terminal domain-containing protein n=2 Tax=Paenibacillus ferrarius TaxID=1469647 RepID=A0A1V4HFC6_9BACL|nr:hypothetical protein BC351_06210 [Paenibacillus ferrarius]
MKRMTLLGGIVSLLTCTTGCDDSNRRRITVIEQPSSAPADTIVLDRIDRLDASFCSGWLTNETLLCTASAETLPTHMQIRHIKTSPTLDTKLPAGSTLSIAPDGKHAFGQGFGEAFLADLTQPDKDPHPIHIGDSGISYLNPTAIGAWFDSQTFILPIAGENAGLALIGIDGTITPIELSDQSRHIQKIVIAAERLFTLDVNQRLKSYDKKGSDVRLVRNHVVDFAVSPDGLKLAATIQASPHQESLIIADTLDSTNEKSLSKGRLLRQLAWSPSGDKLAYATFSLEQGGSGLYVMNARSGSALSLSIQPNIESPIVWSPSGDSLFVAEHPAAEWAAGFTTFYRLKK